MEAERSSRSVREFQRMASSCGICRGGEGGSVMCEGGHVMCEGGYEVYERVSWVRGSMICEGCTCGV